MSERGSYVTQYIYCEKCAEIARRFCVGEPHDKAKEILAYGNVVAAFIKSSSPGGEIHEVEMMADDMSKYLCHDVRIAVLAENGSAIVTAFKSGAGRGTVLLDEGITDAQKEAFQ